MIRITSPMFWLAAAGGGLILLAALLWSVFSRIPVNIEMNGIYLRDTGAAAAPSGEGGSMEADADAREPSAAGVVVCYVQLSDGRRIREGMEAKIYPSTLNRQDYGHICAVVSSVDPYVTSQEDMENVLRDPSLVRYFSSDAPVVAVTCSLMRDSSTASGYRWSGGRGRDVTLEYGTFVQADIVTEEMAPIALLFPLFSEMLTKRGQAGG